MNRFFNKKFIGTSCQTSGVYNSEDQKLAEKLHKPIVRKFKKRKVY